ncbi:hypothetical protein [Pseudomonas sp. EA_35y_Pfl2_R111]|uniref:hypothetical protein n=1 Tax=Pseudomonas sp. EA_35y_Pfl2_R111 TaxID=3088689 RepID=UPI0030DC9E71
MISDQFHPLDELGLFGHTIHGLVTGSIVSAFVEVDGVQFPLPADYEVAEGTLQIVRHPDAGPVALSPEVLAAERVAGRVWQNFALVKEGAGWLSIFGKRVHGWIFIDSLGQRWLARPLSLPNAVSGSPYSFTLRMVPFGYLDGAPMEPVELELTCPDIAQVTGGNRFVRLITANSTGTRGVLQLVPTTPGNALPSGFLEITISDVGGVPSAALSVLLSQEGARGEWDTTHPTTTSPASLFTYHNLLVAAELAGAVYPEGPDIPYFPDGGGTATVTVTGLVETPVGAGLDIYAKGNVSISCGRTGRVLTMAFDDTDTLVPLTFDTRYDYAASVPEWSGEAGGVITSSGDDVHINEYPWTVVDAPSVEVSRTMSESVESTITVRRGGVEAFHVTNRRSYSASLTAELEPYAGAWGWAAGYIGRWAGAGMFAFAERVDTSAATSPAGATAEKGGPWPETTATIPDNVLGNGAVTYLSSFPLGTTERDADVLDFAFTVAYRFEFDVERATLDELADGGTVVREIGLVFPHAELLARGLDRTRAVAYDPISHAVSVADEVGQLISYV